MTAPLARTVDAASQVFAVDLPVVIPSLNELMTWKHHPRLRQWRYRTYSASLREELVEALDGSPLQQAPGAPSRVRVTVTRYSAGTLDDDNLRGGCKPLRDALVAVGVLHDDSPAWLEAHYRQAPAAKNEKRTRLEIEVLP